MTSPNVLLATARPAVHSLFSHIRDIDHQYFQITHLGVSADAVFGCLESSAGAALFAVDVAPDPIAAIQVSQMVHMRSAELPILAITCCPQCLTFRNLQALVASGVSNIFDFHSGAEELADLLHRIINGDLVIHLELGYGPRPLHAEAPARGSLIDGFSVFRPLTEAEIQTLQLLSQGLSDREIGHTVHLSEHTVKHQIERLRSSAGARNRIELAAWAGRHGFSETLASAANAESGDFRGSMSSTPQSRQIKP
jgi:DNA-binding NarL/FixJ family response regulator